jgi:hypothetical protein
MTTTAVHARVRDVLFHDWEGEYNRVLREHGGMPSYPDVIIDHCMHGEFLAPCSGQHTLP